MRGFSNLFRIPAGNGGKAELPKKTKTSPQTGSLESAQQCPGACTEHQEVCWRSVWKAKSANGQAFCRIPMQNRIKGRKWTRNGGDREGISLQALQSVSWRALWMKEIGCVGRQLKPCELKALEFEIIWENYKVLTKSTWSLIFIGSLKRLLCISMGI